MHCKFFFLTPFKGGVLTIHNKSIRFSALEEKETESKGSSLKNHHRMTCQRHHGDDFIICFPLAGCAQGRHRPSAWKREACPDFKAALILLSLSDRVLINAAKAVSHRSVATLGETCEIGIALFSPWPPKFSILCTASDPGCFCFSLSLYQESANFC